MIKIKDKIIAFGRNGELVIFDTREEFEATDIEKEGLNILFASPSDLYRRLLELEEVNESMKGELLGKGQQPERCVGVSEATVRAIKAREDERQEKWGGAEG